MPHKHHANALGGSTQVEITLCEGGVMSSDSTATLRPVDAHDRSTADDSAWRGKSNVEEWRSAHLDRRASDGRSSRSRGSAPKRLADSLGGLNEADLADMTDGEIAQHHFRLAQQHLEAAQRIALAAANTPARSAPTAPSSVGSSRGHRAQPATWMDSASSSGYGESTFERDEPQISPVTPTTDLEADLTRLSLSHGTPTPYEERRRSSLPSAQAVSTPGTSLGDLPSLVCTGTPSAISLRSAPPTQQRRPHDVLNAPVRPQPPSRRATLAAGMSMSTLEMAGSLAPSLYGGRLPAGLADRLGLNTEPSGSAAAQARAAPMSKALPTLSMPSAQPSADSPLSPSAESHTATSTETNPSGRNDTNDDTSSDFFDAQSTTSHVTNSPLPGYSEQYQSRPPVPPLPARYLQPYVPVKPSAPSGPSSLQASAVTPSSPDDEFHGFRPRHAISVVPGSANPWGTIVASSLAGIPAHAAAPPTVRLQPPAPGGTPVYAPSALAAGGLQPHSYILGADGRAIPIYASVPAPSAPTVHVRVGPASAARSALPIHSQPLEFDHSLPYAQQASSAMRPAVAHIVTQASFLPPPAGSSHLQPYSPHASPLAPSAFPVLAPRPSTNNLSLMSRVTSTSTSLGETQTQAPAVGRAASISSTKSRMASLRAAVRGPHVRFLSPSPEARSRASEPVRGRRRSVFGGGEGGGGARALDGRDGQAGKAERGDGNESEEECRMRHRAMQQSLGMLL
ncbi:hypothetical protein JCM3770_001515 [Rhodotorula araucariae]